MPEIGTLEIYISEVNLTSSLTGWDDEKLTLIGTVNQSGGQL